MSQSFFERNRSALIMGAVVVALVGGGIYYNLSAQAAGEPRDAPDAPEPSASKKKRSKKRSGKKQPSPTDQKLHGFPLAHAGDAQGPLYPVIDDFSKVAGLPEEARKELGDMLKNAGNHVFKQQNQDLALEMYSDALKCIRDAVYYSNRSAVYGSKNDWEKVIRDTSAALELNPEYTKCLSRRGLAYERSGEFRNAVRDYTSALIFSGFSDNGIANAVDRTLKLQAERVVAEKYAGKVCTEFPSPSFVTSYFNSFHTRAIPESVTGATSPASGEYHLKLALDAMQKEHAESYKQAIAHLETAVASPFSTAENESLALEYLGTFKFILNNIDDAMHDMNKAIELNPTPQAVIKRSSLHVELSRLDEASSDFQLADRLDPACADIPYQLAQLSFLQQDWETAAKHYRRAIELDDSFILAHIQLAVTKYRQGHQEVAKKMFRNLIQKNPDSANAHNYYGEILIDLKETDEALVELDKAIELEKKRVEQGASMNVLPLVNKALLLVQSSKDPREATDAIDLCREALKIDPVAEAPIGTLAQLYLQQGNTSAALPLFELNAKIARSHAEQVQNITFAEAARAQEWIMRERPALREKLLALGALNT